MPQSDSVHSFDYSAFLVGERESFVVTVLTANVLSCSMLGVFGVKENTRVDPIAVIHADEVDAYLRHGYQQVPSLSTLTPPTGAVFLYTYAVNRCGISLYTYAVNRCGISL